MHRVDQAELTAAVNEILDPFLDRVRVRRGNGLSRAMNGSLRSYPQIPEIIRRTVFWLGRVEQTFQFSAVQVRTWEVYLDLIHEHADWGIDVPVIRKLPPWEVKAIADGLGEDLHEEADLQEHPAFVSNVEFVRERRLPWHQFAAAMTIARRIGLIRGHGRIELDNRVRLDLKHRMTAAGMEGEERLCGF